MELCGTFFRDFWWTRQRIWQVTRKTPRTRDMKQRLDRIVSGSHPKVLMILIWWEHILNIFWRGSKILTQLCQIWHDCVKNRSFQNSRFCHDKQKESTALHNPWKCQVHPTLLGCAGQSWHIVSKMTTCQNVSKKVDTFWHVDLTRFFSVSRRVTWDLTTYSWDRVQAWTNRVHQRA